MSILSKVITNESHKSYVDDQFQNMGGQQIAYVNPKNDDERQVAVEHARSINEKNPGVAGALARFNAMKEWTSKCMDQGKDVKYAMSEIVKSWKNDNSIGMDYALLEKMDKQFADPAYETASNLLGAYTLEQLNVLVSDVGSSVDRSNAITDMVPDVSQTSYNTMSTIWDKIAGIAPEVGTDSSQIPTVQMLGNRQQTFNNGMWGFKISINSQAMFFQKKMGGTSSFNDDGLQQLIALHTVMGQTLINTRKKKTIIDGILTNSFTYNGRTLSLGIPESNVLNMKPIGTLNADGSVSGMDPNQNILNEINEMFASPRLQADLVKYMKGIIFNDWDLSTIMNAQQTKYVMNFFATGAKLDNVATSEKMKKLYEKFAHYYLNPAVLGNLYLGGVSDVWVQADQYGQSTPADLTNDNTKYFLPRGRAIIDTDYASAPNNSIGASLQWANTPNQMDPNQSAMGEFTAVIPRNLMNTENIMNRLDLVFSLSGGLRPIRPKGIWTVNNIYSNVSAIDGSIRG